MSGAPRISVVVPVFNNERYLGETLRSVLGQTAGDFELVVADQRSTDGSRAAAESFGDPRVRVLTNDVTPPGAVPNWDFVTAEARGRYIKLLCADDVLYPACLEAEAAVLDDPANAGVVLVTSPHAVIDESGRKRMTRGLREHGRVPGREAVRRIARMGTNLIGEPSGTLFRAAAFRAAGSWDAEARYVVDLEMWTRLLLQGDLFVVGETLSAFRVQGGSWSNALAHTQTEDMGRLLERLAADPRFGVTTSDVRRGVARAWVNTQLRRAFYRLFLRESVGSDLAGE